VFGGVVHIYPFSLNPWLNTRKVILNRRDIADVPFAVPLNGIAFFVSRSSLSQWYGRAAIWSSFACRNGDVSRPWPFFPRFLIGATEEGLPLAVFVSFLDPDPQGLSARPRELVSRRLPITIGYMPPLSSFPGSSKK